MDHRSTGRLFCSQIFKNTHQEEPHHEKENHTAADDRPAGRRHVREHGRLRQRLTKTVGLLYCSAEPNSEYQVQVVEEYLTGKGITCTRYSFSDSNDVAAVTTKAAADSDVIYIPTDNTAASCTETIGSIVLNAKTPVVAGEKGICAGCGVATLSISYYDLGYKTGEMAAQVLTGEADIAEMPIQYAPATKMYNPTMCEALGITVPEGYEAME